MARGRGITLDPVHGVNPSLMQCFYCGEASGIALLGNQHGKAAPRQAVYDMTPCDQCAQMMRDGVLCCEVDESKSTDPKNPWRTGHQCVVREELICRVVNSKELADAILKRRFTFIPSDAWDLLGLPREESKGVADAHTS